MSMPNRVDLIDYLKFMITTNLVVVGFLLAVKTDTLVLNPSYAVSVLAYFAVTLVGVFTAYILVVTIIQSKGGL